MASIGIPLLVIWLLAVAAPFASSSSSVGLETTGYSNRSFTIAADGSTFLLDGQPTRILSGSVHYFRSLPAQWPRRLQALRAAGFNAVQTYVPWNWHMPNRDGQFDFAGEKNLTHFIHLAQSFDLLVILRPGPYICAEWDFGGLPWWLLSHGDVNAPVRNLNASFFEPATRFLRHVYSRYVQPALLENGGPIAMVQIENEYGWFDEDNKAYLTALRDLALECLGSRMLLYSTDGLSLTIDTVGRTAMAGVFQAIDFFYYGTPAFLENVTAAFDMQHTHEGGGRREKEGRSLPGPDFNGEMYPGWLTKWGDATFPNVTTAYTVDLVRNVLNVRTAGKAVNSSSFNMYMFHGGTNFGFWAGNGVATTYDYEAPLDEAGNPTPKYAALRALIVGGGYAVPPPNVPVPPPTPARAYGSVSAVQWLPLANLTTLAQLASSVVSSADRPRAFEELGHGMGLVAYVFYPSSSQALNATALQSVSLPNPVRDYAAVYALGDGGAVMPLTLRLGQLIGGVNHSIHSNQFPSSDVPAACPILLLVENLGRFNFGSQLHDTWKGLRASITVTSSLGVVKYDRVDMYTLPMTAAFLDPHVLPFNIPPFPPSVWGQPGDGIYVFHLDLSPEQRGTVDTYLDMSSPGWGKGFVLVNGHNLGRYWSTMGPQTSLYVPREWTHLERNVVIVVEQQHWFGTGSTPQLVFRASRSQP